MRERFLRSWNRVLAGRLRDPWIGRDILAGAAGVGLLGLMDIMPEIWLGRTLVQPNVGGHPDVLLGMAHVLDRVNGAFAFGVLIPIFFLFVLLLFRIVFRKQWIAFGALVVLTVLLFLASFFIRGMTEPILILVLVVNQLFFWLLSISRERQVFLTD